MDSTAVVELGCAAFAVMSGVFAYLWQRSESARDETIRGHGQSIEDLKESQSKFELYAARNYLSIASFETAIANFNRTVEAIFAKLERIDDKLEKKADKP